MREKKISRRYDADFRAGAVELAERNDRPLRQAAEDLGIPTTTLWYWCEMARKKKQKIVPARPARPVPRVVSRMVPIHETADEKIARLEREVDQLKKRNDQLELDRAILKKAAAFFAKESE